MEDADAGGSAFDARLNFSPKLFPLGRSPSTSHLYKHQLEIVKRQLPSSSLSSDYIMADRGGAPAGRGGFGSRGDRGGDRGRGGRGRGRGGPRRGGNKSEEKEWQPVTKLGRLVKAGKIKSMEEIYLHSLPIKEYQIVDFFLPKLKDEVMKVRYRKTEHILDTGSNAIALTDQARSKADSCRSANAVQGHCRHRGLRRTRWTGNQDVQGSRNGHPSCHHHRQAQRTANSTWILGHELG